MIRRVGSWSMGAVTLLFLTVAAAGAEEIRQQLNPSVILNMLARPVESPEAAFNTALKHDAVTARAPLAEDGEVQPDGSVRYGRGERNVTVTVRNPCPPGDFAHEAAYYRSLPGRARR
jgi:hypothetical protein